MRPRIHDAVLELVVLILDELDVRVTFERIDDEYGEDDDEVVVVVAVVVVVV